MADLVRLATAGSVDDGKSTLIGRLLYDTKQILVDQLEHIEETSRRRGDAYVNLALLTDGLRAEREQGITIDVAYRYFATARRKFILADTPGHEQYTRNMATGASTADVAILLIDARNGVRTQSKRHARIVLKDGKFIIVDLKSTNGTYVNGRKITSPLVVKESDKIYIGDFILGVEESAAGAGRGAMDAPPPAALDLGLLPEGRLFAPLLADPRWPHFSAAYRYYLGDRNFASAAAFSFGETFPLYRARAGQRAHWEIGLQAGVFSIFDLDSESFDLINADFFVAAFAGYRLGHLATLGRFFHQSSHLGDELLLRRVRPDRINVSYEGLDLKVAYDLPYGLRTYVGGGYLIDPEPSDLKSGSTQVGIEFRSPWVLANGMLRPVAALDIQNREENDWGADLSLRAGVQFDNLRVMSRSLQLLLEYFSGKSSDGQFYNRSVEYIGLGAHFHF